MNYGEQQGHTLEQNIQEKHTVIHLWKKTLSTTTISILDKR